MSEVQNESQSNQNTRKDLGAVSAYAMAVEEGYVGTEAEFGAYLANAGEKAEQTVTNAASAAADALIAEGYAVGTQDGEPVTSQSDYYHNNAYYWNQQAAASAQEASGYVGDLATEETLLLVEAETDESVSLLGQILEAGHSSGDLNGYSLAPGAGGEVILSYTDPETEITTSVVMVTNTTGQAIADALEEEMLMWKEAVEDAR